MQAFIKFEVTHINRQIQLTPETNQTNVNELVNEQTNKLFIQTKRMHTSYRNEINEHVNE